MEAEILEVYQRSLINLFSPVKWKKKYVMNY